MYDLPARAFEGVVSTEMNLAGATTTFCLPERGITLIEVRDGFLALVSAAPEVRDEIAIWSLLDVLHLRYPCASGSEPEGDPAAPAPVARLAGADTPASTRQHVAALR